MMKWIAASVMGIAAMIALAPRAGAAEEYHAFTLVLDSPPDGGFNRPQWTLEGGFVKGVAQLEKTLVRQPPQFDHYSTIREGTLTLDGKVLKGQFKIYDTRLRISTWTLEGAVEGGKATGTYTVKFFTPKTGEEKSNTGKFTGTLVAGSELAKSNAIVAGKDWPCWSGPYTSMTAVPSGQKLVDDLGQARLLWRSQQALGLPQGNFGHPYKEGFRLFYYTTCGGGASPIMGDGKVFATQWFPDGKEYDEAELKKYQDFAATEGVKELHPAMKLHFSKTCHDWYVCMDAATGQTLWTSEFPEETGTYFARSSPDHKTGPVGAAPCYANGKLFGLHLSGYLRAMDAKTGKLLWKQKIAGTEPQGRGNCHNVMFIGGVVMTGNFGSQLYACDPETGAVLWKADCDWVADPQRWVHAGKEYAIVKGGSSKDGVEYRCLEPKTGKVLWSFRGFIFALCIAGISGSSGDTIAVLQGKDGQDEPATSGGGKGRLSIAAYRLTLEKAEKIWEVPVTDTFEGRASVAVLEKYVAAIGCKKSRLLDLATGKEVATVDLVGPVNFGHVQVTEDRLFVRPDGAHGGIGINMVGAAPETFKVMGKSEWFPNIPNTSSYAMKMHTMPIVDGRIYFRGADGIYCYDLRKAAP